MVSHTMSDTVQVVKCLRGGQWVTSSSPRFGEVYNPSSGRVIAQVPMCTKEEVDATVQAAAQALPAWAEKPVVERAQVLFRFRELIRQSFDDLAQLLTREHGKTLAEARASGIWTGRSPSSSETRVNC